MYTFFLTVLKCGFLKTQYNNNMGHLIGSSEKSQIPGNYQLWQYEEEGSF